MKIAVDFDGTIVEHKYPAIGKVRPFAFQTMKMLQEEGHLLILWTYRSGSELDAAVKLCRENGVEFYAINADYPEQQYEPGQSRKIDCDLYIDDKNIGGLPSWGEIYQIICPEEGKKYVKETQKKRPFWKR